MRTLPLTWCATLATLAGAIAACDQPGRATREIAAGPNLWEGCLAGVRFTGGGRVDPPETGKVTFGFNVSGADVCPDGGAPQGQIQVVFHEAGPSLYHSVSLDTFSSFPSEEGGECGEWTGTVRAKHVHEGDWHEHPFYMKVCDNGEPGRNDTFNFWIADDPGDGKHNNVNETLTGGNIQAHTR